MNKAERILIIESLSKLSDNKSDYISHLYLTSSRISIDLDWLETGKIPLLDGNKNRSIEDIKNDYITKWEHLIIQYKILDKIVTAETEKILKDIKPKDLTEEQIKKIDTLFKDKLDPYYE